MTIRLFDKTTTGRELAELRQARPVRGFTKPKERQFTLRDYMGHTYPPYRPIAADLRPFFAASRIEICPTDPMHQAALDGARRNRERIARDREKEREESRRLNAA